MLHHVVELLATRYLLATGLKLIMGYLLKHLILESVMDPLMVESLMVEDLMENLMVMALIESLTVVNQEDHLSED